jgi:hypothetical protein
MKSTLKERDYQIAIHITDPGTFGANNNGDVEN